MNRKQRCVRCLRCDYRAKYAVVPRCCQRCFARGSWCSAPLGMPRQVVDWHAVVSSRRFVPGVRCPKDAVELRADPLLITALMSCFDDVANQWPKVFGVQIGVVEPGRKLGELVYWWPQDTAWWQITGVWVRVHGWYKPR